MKSKFVENIIFILLFSALALFAACSSSDDEEEQSDADSTTSADEDSAEIDDAGDTTEDEETATDDENSTDADTNEDTPDSEEVIPDNEPEDETDTEADTEPSDDTDSGTEDVTDEEFAKNAEGCTMIEVPQITIGGSYADEINGYFGPSLGENIIDIIRIYLMGEIKEGNYELGTGINSTYAQCQQCVMVWVDAEMGAAGEYYFQTSGTLSITEVREVEEIKRTVGTIRHLILKQVEPLNDYLGDFGFISDGKCIAAEIVEWDTTNSGGNSGD